MKIKKAELANNIKNSMKFYDKNFEELLKEGMVKKFDNVTFKTIPKQSKINPQELERYLKKFEEHFF